MDLQKKLLQFNIFLQTVACQSSNMPEDHIAGPSFQIAFLLLWKRQLHISWILSPELPPLLFECKSGADCGVSFGGAPTVFVHNGIPSSESVFHVRSLQSGKLVRGGCSLHTYTIECFSEFSRQLNSMKLCASYVQKGYTLKQVSWLLRDLRDATCNH